MVPPPVAEEKEENRETDCEVVEAHVQQIVISEKESDQTENWLPDPNGVSALPPAIARKQ